jgi:hypothetical protein
VAGTNVDSLENLAWLVPMWTAWKTWYQCGKRGREREKPSKMVFFLPCPLKKQPKFQATKKIRKKKSEQAFSIFLLSKK